MPMSLRRLFPVVAAALLILGRPAVPRAEVVRFQIDRCEPLADGKSFGKVGPYERLIGRVFYEIDPDAAANADIVDLKFAPRNERGRVEFSGDLFLLVPRDRAQCNGTVFYDVNNRGNKLALRFFNSGGGGNDPKTEKDMGDGFLMRHGYVVAWSGWDGELLPGNGRLQLSAPVARDGSRPITGPVRCEIVPTAPTRRTNVSWANHGSYRPTAKGLETATLTHRIRPGEPRASIPRDRWQLHVTEISSPTGGTQLPLVEAELEDGFQTGHIYEVIYEAEDPIVQGVCFAGVRDLISALRHGTGEANPLRVEGKPVIRRAIGFGVSQSGRFLREFLYSGFNADEQGRKVFDGLMPHVAGGGLGSFNHRFAQPTRHSSQHDHHDSPADRFPFAYETQRDPLSGREDGILRRAVAAGTVPFILHTQSAAEYWTRSGSLVHTDPLGRRDAQPPDTVRIYAFGGTQHGPSGFPPQRGIGQNLANPGDYKPFLRALLLALDRWIQDGTPAPPSVHPTIADGTLVDWHQQATGFPAIPGVRSPEVIQQPSWLDFGPRWETERIIDRQPPQVRGDYRVLVPASDADGNDRGCLSPPEVAVPVATYTGWNLRRAEAGAENQLVSLVGSYLPFPIRRADREQTGDPRRSVEERYGTQAEYLKQLEIVCQRLRAAGYLLPEDIGRIVHVQRDRTAPLFETPASR